MSIKNQLDPIIEKWDLLKHPFYLAWLAGTLPIRALRIYAHEYSAFIYALPEAWASLGDHLAAHEEKEHAQLWEQFTTALGKSSHETNIPEVKKLLATWYEVCEDPSSALGGLYAFEVQQPETARSKLIGLRTHYSLPQSVESYFKVHSMNWNESEKLLNSINELPSNQQMKSLVACEVVSRSLWDALSGIHAHSRAVN